MKNRLLLPPSQADPPLDCLRWAESNLSALSKLTAGRMNGGDTDHVHLACMFGLLKARQQIRAALRESDSIRREVVQ